MRVGRVRLRADVFDADVAVVDRLVDESDIGADVVRSRREKRRPDKEIVDENDADHAE